MDIDNSSSLAWHWVIEALAGCSEISTTTLQALIDVAPVGRDEFCENTRDLIALKCLEELCSSANAVNKASSSLDSRVEFDFSRSCEDVLQEIVREIPFSELKVDRTKLLKWDLSSFVKHKRAGMAKCHLQQLKESILGGTLPLTDYLKKRSGLFHHGSSASNLYQSSSHNEALHESNIPFNTTSMPRHAFGAEIPQQQQIESVPTTVALSDGIQHKISGGKPCSNNQTGLQPEDQNDSQQFVAIPTNDDNADKIQHIVTSLNVSQKPVEGDKIVVDSINGLGVELSSGSDGIDNEKIDLAPEDQNDSQQIVAIPTNEQTVAIPTNDDNADKIQHVVASLNVSQKPVVGDKIVVNSVNGPGVELLSDSAEIDNEKIDLASEMHELPSLHGMFGQDFSAMAASTEQNLCMKCNESGQLLACKTTTCPLMVHENCIGASAQLDANGNFFCPFCAYSHTISEYLEANTRASLAGRELSMFSGKSRRNEADNVELKRSQLQAPISSVHLLCREKEKINDGFVAVLRREEERDEMANEKILTGGRVEEKELPTDQVDGHDGDKLPCKNTNAVSASQSNAGEEVPQETTKQHNMDGTVEPVRAHDTGKKVVSEDKCEKPNISDFRYSKRVRKHETQCEAQASPKRRRKKILWTEDEEGLIREGVHKFHVDNQRIPWKEILAFGSHVFDKHRTAQDLKDKWKNLCKS